MTKRMDILALWGGLIFSLAFTALIWLTGDRLVAFVKPPDQGFTWYYWQLAEPTWVTRGVVWGLYLLHQFFNWGLIYYAQSRPHRYTTRLHPVNIVALGANALFIVLHYVQTHLWYDGLAQDTSIYSSQGAVVVLLAWVLLMENSRRGLFLGYKAPLGQSVVEMARKYHGYYFSWAILFTFWFHPMENTTGHLIGFGYMFLLMLQSSLFFTRIHVNKWWTLAQELTVLFHGTLVAIDQLGTGREAIWPMFFFGFLGIFIITQMHGLGLSRRVRAALFVGYLALMFLVYRGRGWENANEVIRIPMIDYPLVFILAGVLWLLMKIGRWLAPRFRRPAALMTINHTSASSD